MSEAVNTLEGWYALHDFRSIDWTMWTNSSEEERNAALDELQSLAREWAAREENKQGSSVMFTVVGHKADIAFMHLRPTLEELDALETAFNKTRFAAYTMQNYSYVSIVELSSYISHAENPEEDPAIQARLKPALPKAKNVCFYPMNKKREGNDNWYMLSMEERRGMMRSHGMIGRGYAGRVTQIITGSVGLDDWEWGVTLFADDPVVFKKLVYEMRFDEASARFGEFGTFIVGNRLTEERFAEYFSV
ncbi:hydrogen peroxide-dependent heme synthase [Aneurinibacillus tyrosinisolvens]|uniref:hydrogen peroxide-dependent heme synthase n=1 Tax=Aneurinibacillus tyrosinisolvens TaxID=1443435 RepID=UPI00063F63E2|nr:hydrogen peroxide-dependent heme synthase [Aneurinibacillus tyrosinisolvens]